MSSGESHRKLAAILSTDAKDYSRLMGDDEAATVETLKAYKGVIERAVEASRGRVVDSSGDNLLAEFSSVVNAVQCAVEIQQDLKGRNEGLPINRRLEFRIGVNLGDVIEEGDRIYGDGINIAARIEGLAEPGGVCISRSVYDQIKDKLDLGYEFLGARRAKNIKDPVMVYKVLMDPVDAGRLIGQEQRPPAIAWLGPLTAFVVILIAIVGWIYYQNATEPDSPQELIQNAADTFSDEPSIAVMPFKNISGNPDQEYFSDGITEQIITSLSNVPSLFVIARSSTFAYKNKPAKVQHIAEELGVKYILEGSALRSEDKVRIAAKLIDATTGHHLWAASYDREMKDIFELYDDITMKIIAELQVELTSADLGQQSSIKTDNLKAYEKLLRGYRYLWNRTVGDTLEARKLAQEAIALDSRYGAAYQLLAGTYLDEIYFHQVESRDEHLEKAERLIQQSVEYGGSDYQTHRMLSNLYFLKRQFDKSIAEGRKAVELNPNSADANYTYGMVLGLSGRHDQAIPVLQKAIRLNPVTPINYLNQLAFALQYKKQYEKAIRLWKQTLQRNPDYYYAHLGLTASYLLNGEEGKAREHAAELLRVKPEFSVSMLEKRIIQEDREGRERVFGALRKAGLPE